MTQPRKEFDAPASDVEALNSLGYRQELRRRMSGFSNYAVSLSAICVLAGGITSFHQGLCSGGGAAVGIGWPLSSLLSLAFAATMGQVASAFPTAGGLYHWAAILGGRGWGWATAWFNLLGLITVLAAVNVGAYRFVLGALGPYLGYDPSHVPMMMQLVVVAVITISQAFINHRGIRATTLLTDFSGYWILVVGVALAAALLAFAPGHDFSRLVTFTNYSGLPAGDDPVWPRTENIAWLFALGFILPAYTITGFDASAHTAEETLGASQNVPNGMVRSVLVSALFGWFVLAAVILAIPDMEQAARQGENAFNAVMSEVLPGWLALGLFVGIGSAQYLCGLAIVTSASRMVYAFARDGGLPFSSALRRVSPAHRTPAVAVWVVALLAVLFTVYTPVYDTIVTVAVILLYLSYVTPALLGLCTLGRSWTRLGPWALGRWFRPLAIICIFGCVFFFVIGVQPPNDKALGTVLATAGALLVFWFGYARAHFAGPPRPVAEKSA